MRTKPENERRFQIYLNIFIALLSFGFGISSGYLLEIRSSSVKKHNLAKLICASVTSDIKLFVVIQDRLREQVLKKKFIGDSFFFDLYDFPPTALPSSEEVGCLEPDVITGLNSYSRCRVNAAHRRMDYRERLLSKTDEHTELAFVNFCIAHDAMIVDGLRLLDRLYVYYPDLKLATNIVPQYVRLSQVITNVEVREESTNGMPVQFYRFIVGYE